MAKKLVLTRGLMATGKSALSRTLGRRLGWPVLDKDDINDVLIEKVGNSGTLAYEAMFSVAESLLAQGFSVICDSPLRDEVGLENASRIAAKHGAAVRVLALTCSDDRLWRKRLEGRERRPAQSIATWEAFLPYREAARAEFDYPNPYPALEVDTAKPLSVCVEEVLDWLENQGGARWSQAKTRLTNAS